MAGKYPLLSRETEGSWDTMYPMTKRNSCIKMIVECRYIHQTYSFELTIRQIGSNVNYRNISFNQCLNFKEPLTLAYTLIM